MSRKLIDPHFVIVQSDTNKKQYFYIVIFALPADTEQYPDPTGITPQVIGTELIYETSDYAIPADYDGEVITYVLQPLMIESSDESAPNITSIIFKGLNNTEKKGDTAGVTIKQREKIPNNNITTRDGSSTSTDYICNNRCFVIKSPTHDKFFVGTLVDYPNDRIVGITTHLANTTELQIERVVGTNPYKTLLVINNTPGTYDSATNTATYTEIFVNGYNTSDYKGIFLDDSENLYTNPWTTK